jgi:ABC-2 type transport system ATP-binding protein
VRLESVGKRYGFRQPWVVRDVSLEVPAGRLIRLEGRNGSGKSTLLRIAAGVSLPSTGRVTGRPHTGYVPERFPGAFLFSGRDYLMHMGRIHGLRGASVAAQVDDWLDRLDAAGYARAPLRSMSKGMCQKMAVAQAMLSRPGLLVLDEAWTGLDQAARATLDAAVAERVGDGGTVMFVDHEQARLADQVGERWLLDGSGQVTRAAITRAAVTSTAVTRAAAVQQPTQATAADRVVMIELSGVSRLDADRLHDLPQARALSAKVADPAAQIGVWVNERDSDALLRQVLSWPGVHVVAVRAQERPRDAGPAGEGGAR